MKYNNLLATALAVGIIPILWAAQGAGWLILPEAVVGATITLETTIVYFYFRKSPPTTTNGGQ